MKNEADNGAAEASADKGKQPVLKKLKKKGSGFFTDFKAFINKGNVMNLAIGLAMGAAFTAIVTSLVADLMMPIVSIFFGKNNLGDMVWDVSDTLTISWGKFVLAVINFLIVALFLFLLIRVVVKAESGLSSLKKLQKKAAKQGLPPPEVPAEPAKKIESTEDILKDIRALLTQLSLQTPAAAENADAADEKAQAVKEQTE